MMQYEDFYDIAVYGNTNWKGSFTQKEIACNAYDYLVEFEVSKARKRPLYAIKELVKLLMQDGTDDCLEWVARITSEIESGVS